MGYSDLNSTIIVVADETSKVNIANKFQRNSKVLSAAAGVLKKRENILIICCRVATLKSDLNKHVLIKSFHSLSLVLESIF